MNTGELLEKYFDVAFAATDGIKKLRELILSLAMQGKLVPQDGDDRPASELLKEIEAEKGRLVKDGKIKASKPLPEIKPDEVPYDLPKGWEWVRLGDFGTWKSGTTPSRSNHAYYGGEISWVKSGEVKQGRIKETEEKITHEALKSCSLDINPIGSVLVAMYGANIGEVGILEIEATTNQAVCACKTFSAIDNIYLLHLILSLKQNFLTQGAGAAQPNISREKIINTIVPLPPLAEQRRIVAKIDELMARCDELEKLKSERDRKQITVHKAALNRLLTAKDHSDFQTSWHFITQHFSELYSVKENLAELRKAILQLAVMGKLVPQDPSDQPANELIKEIEKEKTRLVKEKKIKAQKPLQETKPKELPYQLPQNWEWCYLDDICTLITDGTHHTPQYTETGVPFLSVKDISSGKINFSTTRFISEQEHHELIKRCHPEKGDVLLTKVGTTGIAVPINTNKEFGIFVSVSLLKLVQNFIDTDYVTQLINSPLVKKYSSDGTEGVGNKNLVLRKIKSFLIPLPPLAEQHRIVSKIDQLMTLCDELEKQIDTAESKQTNLLNSLMAKV